MPRARLLAATLGVMCSVVGCHDPHRNAALAADDQDTRDLLAHCVGLDSTQPIDVAQLGQFVENPRLERTESIDVSRLRVGHITPQDHFRLQEVQPAARQDVDAAFPGR